MEIDVQMSNLGLPGGVEAVPTAVMLRCSFYACSCNSTATANRQINGRAALCVLVQHDKRVKQQQQHAEGAGCEYLLCPEAQCLARSLRLK